MYDKVTFKVGETVRLMGETREYTATVVEAEPGRVLLRLGDKWLNQFRLKDGVWRGEAKSPGRNVPKTVLLGVVRTPTPAA